ncbi:MAG: cytochrome C [Lewinellaceae bacterium]|nr:cytochrome C [Lewinellaceae bacterium]
MQKLLLSFLPLVMLLMAAQPVASPDPTIPAEIASLLNKYSCVSCHALDKKMIGPSWKDIAKKGYSKKKIAELVVTPQPSNWPTYPPMAPLPAVPKADLGKIATWLTAVK